MSDRERVPQSQVWAGALPSPRGMDFSLLSSWGVCPPSQAGPVHLSAGGCLTLETPPPPLYPTAPSTGLLLRVHCSGTRSTGVSPQQVATLGATLSSWSLFPQGPAQDQVVNKGGEQRRPCSSPRDLNRCLRIWRKELRMWSR